MRRQAQSENRPADLSFHAPERGRGSEKTFFWLVVPPQYSNCVTGEILPIIGGYRGEQTPETKTPAEAGVLKRLSVMPYPNTLAPAAPVPSAMATDTTADRAPDRAPARSSVVAPVMMPIATIIALAWTILDFFQFTVFGRTGERCIEIVKYAARITRNAGKRRSRLHRACKRRRSCNAQHSGEK